MVTTKFKVIYFLPTNVIRTGPMILLVSPENSMHPFNLTSRLLLDLYLLKLILNEANFSPSQNFSIVSW